MGAAAAASPLEREVCVNRSVVYGDGSQPPLGMITRAQVPGFFLPSSFAPLQQHSNSEQPQDDWAAVCTPV